MKNKKIEWDTNEAPQRAIEHCRSDEIFPVGDGSDLFPQHIWVMGIKPVFVIYSL